MSWQRFDGDGTLTEHGADGSRTVTDYTTDPPTVRPYTAEENAAADAAAAQAALAANLETIGGRMVTEDMPAMAAILAQTNAAIRTDPSQEIKELARACRRLQRHVLQLLDGTE